MATQISAWRDRGGRGARRTSRTSTSASIRRRAGCASRPRADEPRHDPRLRDLQAGLDQAAAEEAARSRNARRPREYLDRESHYVWGKRYLLKIVEVDDAARRGVEAQAGWCCGSVPATDPGERGRRSSTSGIASRSRKRPFPLIAKWEPHPGRERASGSSCSG